MPAVDAGARHTREAAFPKNSEAQPLPPPASCCPSPARPVSSCSRSRGRPTAGLPLSGGHRSHQFLLRPRSGPSRPCPPGQAAEATPRHVQTLGPPRARAEAALETRRTGASQGPEGGPEPCGPPPLESAPHRFRTRGRSPGRHRHLSHSPLAGHICEKNLEPEVPCVDTEPSPPTQPPSPRHPPAPR